MLTLIVAQLLHTLRFVVLRREIVIQPFLFAGLIAVVKRILIVTAELERQDPGKRALTNQLLELGVFGVPVLALAPAIYLVRRGGRNSEHPEPSEDLQARTDDRESRDDSLLSRTSPDDSR